MKWSLPTRSSQGFSVRLVRSISFRNLLRAFSVCVLAGCASAVVASAQAITIDTSGRATTSPGSSTNVDRRFRQIEPTNIALPSSPLDPKTRLELIRFLQSDQGFAMRPFPRGHKGLTLVANGKLEPAGEAYLNMVTANGLSAKPGDRLVISDVKIDHGKMVFELNGGPDAKHRFLRHVQIGAGGPDTSPVVQQGDEQEPVGSRLTLTFKGNIPELTGKQVEALLAPLISFEVKTPIQAFTDTLPPKLKQAILDHNVLVGMSTDMVLFAKGQPQNKIREMDGQMPFEEWIYGRPPSDIEFVRINGNRVIRVEDAKVGKPPVIFTKDEVEGLMRTDGTPLSPEQPGTHTVQMGDVDRDPDKQAPAAPPSLRKPGETIPADDGKDARVGVMRPVQFPKQAPDDEPNARPNGQPDSTQSSSPASSPTAATPTAATPTAQSPSTDASQSPPAKPQPAGGNPPPQ
jgi:hypothetical protein